MSVILLSSRQAPHHPPQETNELNKKSLLPVVKAGTHSTGNVLIISMNNESYFYIFIRVVRYGIVELKSPPDVDSSLALSLIRCCSLMCELKL